MIIWCGVVKQGITLTNYVIMSEQAIKDAIFDRNNNYLQIEEKARVL